MDDECSVAGRLSRALGEALGATVASGCERVSPLLGAPAALAVPWCDTRPCVRVLRSGLGVLESAIVDPRGRLFFTSQTYDGLSGAVLRIDHPDAEPVKLAGAIASPGGLAFDDCGKLIVGFGDSPGGLTGNLVGLAGLLLLDPEAASARPGSPAWGWRTGSPAPATGRSSPPTISARTSIASTPTATCNGAGRESRPPTASRSTPRPLPVRRQTFVGGGDQTRRDRQPRQHHHPRPAPPARAGRRA